MEIKSKLLKTKYSYEKDHKTHLLVELSAPKIEWQKERCPICIIPVLDVSGSMMGEKLDYVKKACEKLIDHLSCGDFMGLVAFDSEVKSISEIVKITQNEKDVLKNKVSKLTAGSLTNMSGGIVQAFKYLNNIELPKNIVLRIVIFTDGLSNCGVIGRDMINFLKERKTKATISAFGFGTDCDQELLADIANVCNGNYAYIESIDAAITAFARELGGLISTFGQDIKVKITPTKNNKILNILNDEIIENNDGIKIVNIKDILSEEKKWIVLEVQLSSVKKTFPRKINLFNIFVSYTDKNGDLAQIKDCVKVNFCKPEDEDLIEDSEVIRERDKLLAAQAQDKAEQYARMGQYDLARKVIINCCDNLEDANIKNIVNSTLAYYNFNYISCSGTTNTIRYGLKGKRSVSGCSLDGLQASNSAMDLMEKSFKTSEKEVLKEEKKSET